MFYIRKQASEHFQRTHFFPPYFLRDYQNPNLLLFPLSFPPGIWCGKTVEGEWCKLPTIEFLEDTFMKPSPPPPSVITLIKLHCSLDVLLLFVVWEWWNYWRNNKKLYVVDPINTSFILNLWKNKSTRASGGVLRHLFSEENVLILYIYIIWVHIYIYSVTLIPWNFEFFVMKRISFHKNKGKYFTRDFFSIPRQL
jgi:hypothetical protein